MKSAVAWSKVKKYVRKYSKVTALTLLELAGAALLVIGATLVYEPAGYIVAGASLIFVSWRHRPR